MNARRTWCIGLLVAIPTGPVIGQTADMIGFQGLIRDANGVPLEGSADFEFRIYDAPVGGNLQDLDGNGKIEDEIGKDAKQVEGVVATQGVVATKFGPVSPKAWAIMSPTAATVSERWLEARLDGMPLSRVEWVTKPATSVAVDVPEVGLTAMIVARSAGTIVDPETGKVTVLGNNNVFSPEAIVADGIVGAVIGGGGSASGGTAAAARVRQFARPQSAASERVAALRDRIRQRWAAEGVSQVGGTDENTACDSYVVVGGGIGNTAGLCDGTDDDALSVTAGGIFNQASGFAAVTGGGQSNWSTALGSGVASGTQNTADQPECFIGGGANNICTTAGTAAAGAGSTTVLGTIGGGFGNTVTGEIATIAGGHSNVASSKAAAVGGGLANRAGVDIAARDAGLTAGNATVAGGTSNVASATSATVGGGSSNTASGENSTVAGGLSNSATGERSTVAGGDSHTASGGNSAIGGGGANTASGELATVSGGLVNTASGAQAAVGGGANNTASAATSTVGGGAVNTASGLQSVVGGGWSNTASGESSTVPGGDVNTAFGVAATIGGGRLNVVGVGSVAGRLVGGCTSPPGTSAGKYTTISGGANNTACAEAAAIGGGDGNQASGYGAVIPGGLQNSAGGTTSFAGGQQAKVRTPAEVGGNDTDGDQGTFVWADATAVDFVSTGPNQFLIRAAGGVGIGTNAPEFLLHVNGEAGKPGGGSWATASDRRLKKNIHTLRGSLTQLLRLHGVNFEYKDPKSINERPGERTGMIAQEVEQIFPDWIDEAPDGYKRLTFRGFEALTVEALRDLREEKDAQIADQARHIAELTARLQRVETLLSSNNNMPKGGAR